MTPIKSDNPCPHCGEPSLGAKGEPCLHCQIVIEARREQVITSRIILTLDDSNLSDPWISVTLEDGDIEVARVKPRLLGSPGSEACKLFASTVHALITRVYADQPPSGYKVAKPDGPNRN